MRKNNHKNILNLIDWLKICKQYDYQQANSHTITSSIIGWLVNQAMIGNHGLFVKVLSAGGYLHYSRQRWLDDLQEVIEKQKKGEDLDKLMFTNYCYYDMLIVGIGERFVKIPLPVLSPHILSRLLTLKNLELVERKKDGTYMGWDDQAPTQPIPILKGLTARQMAMFYLKRLGGTYEKGNRYIYKPAENKRCLVDNRN